MVSRVNSLWQFSAYIFISVSGHSMHLKFKLLQALVGPINFTIFLNVIFGGFSEFETTV